MIEPQQTASVDLLNFSSKASQKTSALDITGTGGKSAKQSFSSQLSDARRSMDSEQSDTARSAARPADQEYSDEASIEAKSDSGPEQSDEQPTDSRSKERDKAKAEQNKLHNEQSTEAVEGKKKASTTESDADGLKPDINGPQGAATVSISHLSALQAELLSTAGSDVASLQVPGEDGLPATSSLASDSDQLAGVELVDAAQTAALSVQKTGDSHGAVSTLHPTDTEIAVEGRSATAQDIEPVPANEVLPGLTIKSARNGLNSGDGAVAKTDRFLGLEVGTEMSLANLANRYRKVEERTGKQASPLIENLTPATAVSKGDASGTSVPMPVHSTEAKLTPIDTDVNARASIAAAGKAQVFHTDADLPENNLSDEVLNDELRNQTGKESNSVRQSNQMDPGNSLAGKEQLSLQRAANALTNATAPALSVAEPIQNSAGPSLENMFLSVASGIVTAPLQSRSLPDAGAMINAPLNVALLSDNAGSDMASNIRWMSAEGVKNAVINVTPSGMGPISVQIGIEDDQMSVSIIAVQGSTREALDSMLPRLREQLLAQGHDSVRVDVSDGKSEQSKTGSGQQQTEDFSDAATNGNTSDEDKFNQMSETNNTEKDESINDLLIQDIAGIQNWQPGKYDLYV